MRNEGSTEKLRGEIGHMRGRLSENPKLVEREKLSKTRRLFFPTRSDSSSEHIITQKECETRSRNPPVTVDFRRRNPGSRFRRSYVERRLERSKR